MDKQKISPGYAAPFHRQWLSPAYWHVWLLVLIMRLSIYLPRRLMAALGWLLGRLAYRINGKRRAIVLVNLKLAFPEKSEHARQVLAKNLFVVLFQVALDLPLLWWASDGFLRRYIKIEGLAHYRHHLQQGHRVILFTGHYAALEMGGILFSRYFPAVGLIKPVKNPVVNWLIWKTRVRYQGICYTREHGMRPIIRAVKGGYGLYYLPDEDHGPEKSIFVPFLGTVAATIPAAARLVTVTGAVALPVYVRRLAPGKGYEMVIQPALRDFPSGDENRDAATINAVLAENIKRIPDQYMWTLKLFKTRPGGAASPYAGG